MKTSRRMAPVVLGLLLSVPIAAAEPVRLNPENPRDFLLRGKPTFTSGDPDGAVPTADSRYASYLNELPPPGDSRCVTSAAPSTAGACGALTIDCVVGQNSGRDTGVYPAGVPTGYSWYSRGLRAGTGYYPPPAGMTAITGYGHAYPQRDMPNPPTTIYIRNFRTYVHLASGGWRLVQDQATQSIAGAHFDAAFTPHAPAIPLKIVVQSDGSLTMDSPAARRNNHWWPGARGSYMSGTINGAFVMQEMRIDNPNANIIAGAGADYWKDAGIGYAEPVGTHNPALGISSWIKLTTSYQYSYYTNLTRAQLMADPPPPLVGAPATPPPPVIPDP